MQTQASMKAHHRTSTFQSQQRHENKPQTTQNNYYLEHNELNLQQKVEFDSNQYANQPPKTFREFQQMINEQVHKSFYCLSQKNKQGFLLALSKNNLFKKNDSIFLQNVLILNKSSNLSNQEIDKYLAFDTVVEISPKQRRNIC